MFGVRWFGCQPQRAIPCIGLFLFALVPADVALACSVSVPTITRFMADKKAGKAVFAGKVVAVRERKIAAGQNPGIELIARMTVSEWFAGESSGPEVVVTGFIESPKSRPEHPCQGVGDFVVKAGEFWLIFGHFKDGKIAPAKFVSRQIEAGAIPAQLREQIAGVNSKGEPAMSNSLASCADRPNFISREICLTRVCGRAENEREPLCVERRGVR